MIIQGWLNVHLYAHIPSMCIKNNFNKQTCWGSKYSCISKTLYQKAKCFIKKQNVITIHKGNLHFSPIKGNGKTRVSWNMKKVEITQNEAEENLIISGLIKWSIYTLDIKVIMIVLLIMFMCNFLFPCNLMAINETNWF